MLSAAIALFLLGALPPDCARAIADARGLAGRGDRAGADRALEAAERGAEAPSRCVAAILRARAELAVAAGDHSAAARHYRRAAHRTPDDAEWRALTSARIAAERRAKHPKTAARLEGLAERERALTGRAPGRFDAAREAFRLDKDPARVAWVSALEARALAQAGDVPGAERLATPLVEGTAPAFVRLVALEALAQAGKQGKNALAEASAALRLDALRAEGGARDRHVRSRLVAEACARYEREAGEGRCAALSKDVTGEYSFADLSRGKPKRSLAAGELERAQRQYGFAIEGCVRDAARANADGELFENASLKVSWTVRGDGRAGGVEIEPKRYEAALGACVRERVGWFRYPRWTDGSVRSIALPFSLELTERYGGRR